MHNIYLGVPQSSASLLVLLLRVQLQIEPFSFRKNYLLSRGQYRVRNPCSLLIATATITFDAGDRESTGRFFFVHRPMYGGRVSRTHRGFASQD